MLHKITKVLKLVSNLCSSDITVSVRTILSLVHQAKLFNCISIRRLISHTLRKSYGVYLSPECSYGQNLTLKHPVGIVIGSGVRIGNNVTLFQNVTLGARRMGDGGGDQYPFIGDNTVIFAGAVVLGGISIGNNCIIGANAVVLSDIPDGATAVGVPAKILRSDGI